jgi:pro-kumamolisin-like protein/putative Ig domain-containing protein/subtilase family protein
MAAGSSIATRAACALAVAMLLPVAAAGAASVRVGRAPAVPAGARFVGHVPAATRLRVTVALRPRDPAALAAYARAVSTPGSASYRRYLTPAQFGQRFGATTGAVDAVRRSLRAQGLRPGAVSRGSLSISVTATAAQLERAFSVSLTRMALPGRRIAIRASAAPALPASLAGAVQSVVGLNTTAAPRPLLVRAHPGPGRAPLARSHVVTGGPQPCGAASAAAPGQDAYTADEIASAYGFSGLYAAGDNGAGVTVAVYELEPDEPADIAAYQSCLGTHATISYVPVDGGAGTGPGSGEAALDIENLIGLAPDVNVLVYQGPNSNSGAPGSGPYDTFSAIVNQDRARVVTVSWGQCESVLGRTDAAAENTLFQQATIQGQSIVAASGDSGAEDCDTGGAIPQTQPAVDDPSSQPFVTGVGGTTLSVLGPRPTESVWNSGGTILSGMLQPGAGGGGISSLWAMPAPQATSAPALDVRTAQAVGTICGHSGGFCREVPDVAADGDPATGYLIYWNGRGSVTGEPAGWQGIGGTSGAAPLWAALLALTDGSRACAGAPIGYANPSLYAAAGAAYAEDFNDVTTGDNDFTATNGGRYAAAPGYDPATGLGTPNAASLAAALCATSIRLANPGAQRATVHTPVSLRLRASATSGALLRYGAAGLPPGVRVDTATGRITGRPTRAGQYTVHASARDSQSRTAGTAFRWTVAGAPEISRLSLRQTPVGPQLALTITAGKDAPDLRTLQITVPHVLTVATGPGITVASTTRKPARLRFTDRASRSSVLTVKLRRTTRSVRITLIAPSLRARSGRVADVTFGRGRQVVMVSVVDAAARRTRLSEKVAVTR